MNVCVVVRGENAVYEYKDAEFEAVTNTQRTLNTGFVSKLGRTTKTLYQIPKLLRVNVRVDVRVAIRCETKTKVRRQAKQHGQSSIQEITRESGRRHLTSYSKKRDACPVSFLDRETVSGHNSLGAESRLTDSVR